MRASATRRCAARLAPWLVLPFALLVAVARPVPATGDEGPRTPDAADAARWLAGIPAALHPGETMSARARLWTRDAEGVEESLVLDWLRRTAKGERRLVLEVRRPEAMEGTVHQLAFPEAGSVERLVWAPARGRVNRMRGDRPTDPFMGSFFTYEDLGFLPMASGAPLRMRRFEESGEGRVAVRSGPYGIYLGVEVILDAATGLPLRAVFRDRADFPFRYLRFSDVRERDGLRIPMRIEVEDALSGVRSRLEFDHVRFDVPVDPDLFEPDFGASALRRGTRIDVPDPADSD